MAKEENLTPVHFMCQFCRQPLSIDSEVLNLNSYGFQALTSRDDGSPGVSNNTSEGEGEDQRRRNMEGTLDERLRDPARADLPSPSSPGATYNIQLDEPPSPPPVVAPDGTREGEGEGEGAHLQVPAKDCEPSEPFRVKVAGWTSAESCSFKNDSINESFVVLANSRHRPHSRPADHIPRHGLSHRIKVANRLFDILSGESDIDHPLCADCTDQLLQELKVQVDETEAEARYYCAFRDSQLVPPVDSNERDMAVAEVAKMEEEEQQILRRLKEIDSERLRVQDCMSRLKQEDRALAIEEERHWKAVNEFCRQYDEYLADRESVDIRYHHACEQLDTLKRTNILNDAFHIYFAGPFGTINNFRLGRLPDVPVEWAEINAAWGQAVLLLNTLAKKLQFVFTRFVLVPKGSQSCIERIDNQQVMELYMSSGLHMFQAARYDQGMVAFLNCLQQMTEHLLMRDPIVTLPY
eukprot:Ihof_evm7s41 gene=Ihof_evmTU7s41